MAHINPIQTQKYLKGVDYPASRQVLLDTAKREGADENICESLEQLPDEDFQTPADVSKALGKLDDGGTSHAGQKKHQDQDQSENSAGAFLAWAMKDSVDEIELCELALEKASDDDVKAFAQKMIDDHSQMGKDIERLAKKLHCDLPTHKPSEKSPIRKKLEGLRGKDFDRKFAEHNVNDHQDDIEKFRRCAGQADDADLKAFAAKGEKTLEKHLKMSKDLQAHL